MPKKVTHKDATLSCLFLITFGIFLLLLIGNIIGFGAFLLFSYKMHDTTFTETIILFCIHTKWWIPAILCFPCYCLLYIMYRHMSKTK